MAASFRFLATLGLLFGTSPAVALPPQSTTLTSLTVSANTGEKPQSKVWTQDGRWFCVMPNASGTWVWRLDGTTWTSLLQLSASTGTHADVKSLGSVAHVLLYNGGSSQLASIEYLPGTQSYQMWTTRPANVALPLSASTETASLDVDSQGRMWVATDYAAATSQIVVYYADAPYSAWSGPVTLATGINADDIAVVTAMPDGHVGVLWSNQTTQRFGFRRHVDGADPTVWSADELPASQSALNVGLGMADDHLNVAVATDGTLYAAVKTSYDTAGFPKIALLVRRPAGTWDDLYEVSETGTRGIVLLDETAGVVTVLYTSVEGSGNILYKETPTAAISFGASSVLMPGGLNDVTSTKQNLTGEAVILAGNGSTMSGRLLDGDVDAPPGQPALAAPADQATGVSPAPILDVVPADPDSPALTVRFYGRAAGAPPGPDFTLIGLPDTQYYTGQVNGGRNIMFQTQTNWIVANKAARNIAYTVQLGDCVENGDNGGNNIEWLRADSSLSILENPLTTGLDDGMPYGVCVGNHDQSPSGNPDGTTTFYNQFFGAGRFAGRPYYGGHFADNNDTHFDLFSASGMDFIVICFEYDTTPDANVLNWADSLLTVHAGRRAIVASHHIVNSGNPASFGAQGQAIYDALRGHPNLFMMLGGHVSTEGRRSDTYLGNTVHSMLSDYQGRTGGGNGWLRILEFSPANDVIRVRTYSPWLGTFEADSDSSSQFTLPYDMSSAGPYQLLGTVSNVAPGAHATLAWPGRTPGTEYEWYVTVDDGVSTTTSSPTWTFTTGSDVTPPAAVGDLVATSLTSGNDASGRTRIALGWSGAEAGAAVRVYRKGYGNHPFYAAGSAPSAPADPAAAVNEGWTLTAVSAPGQTDQPPTRDHWYYVLFLTDAGGNTSAVSNRTAGNLDYILGDVANGVTDCAGDNSVGTGDVSLLGAHYGMAVSGPGDPHACLDVGPTVDYSATARPAPDGLVQFEDLVLFSINFTGFGAPATVETGSAPVAAAANEITLDAPSLPGVGETFALTVRASGRGDVHALGLELGYDAAVVEMIGVDGGELLDRQRAQAVTLSPRPGRVDVALLGADAGLAGEGELAQVRFRVKAAGAPTFAIRSIDARDGANRRLLFAGSQPASRPAMTQLAFARPNPFTQTVSIGFSLAVRGAAEVAVYDVNGRCVRVLARGAIEAGEHTMTWNGRDDRGMPAAAGVYYLRLATEQGRFTRVLTYLK